MSPVQFPTHVRQDHGKTPPRPRSKDEQEDQDMTTVDSV